MAEDLKDLAEKADKLYTIREARLALQKQVDELKKVETELETELIERISADDAMGVVGKLRRATVVRSDEPVIEDYTAFMTYVATRKQFDLVQRRLSSEAVKLRWAAGKAIPGIGVFHRKKISLTKL